MRRPPPLIAEQILSGLIAALGLGVLDAAWASAGDQGLELTAMVSALDESQDFSEFGTTYKLRGSAYVSLGEYERAILDFDEAIRLNGADGDAYAKRGNTYAQAGEFRKAVADYDEVVRLNPQYAPVYANRASAHTILGNDEPARRDVEQAVALGIDRSSLEERVAALRNQR